VSGHSGRAASTSIRAATSAGYVDANVTASEPPKEWPDDEVGPGSLISFEQLVQVGRLGLERLRLSRRIARAVPKRRP
jgi:hypothetical protein